MTSAPAQAPAPTPAPTRRRRVLDAIDERLGIKALAYPVPEHANTLGWSLGGVSAVSLVILIVTGILLAQFYSPIPEDANFSVRRIMTEVWGGGFVRSLHFWSAQALYVTVFLHMIRVFFTGSYKKPREANWLIGVSMLGLITLALFTGTVLKWDQEGFEALEHNVGTGRFLGAIAGAWFTPEFADPLPILIRLYSAHVVIIPGLILALLALHALLVKKHKISPHPSLPTDPSGEQSSEQEPTAPFTHHLRRISAFGVALLGILGIIAVLLPPALGSQPVEGLEFTRPPWTYWWIFTVENWFGLPGLIFSQLAFFVLLLALPFLDRNPQRFWRRRPIVMIVALIVVFTMIVLTLLVPFLPPALHLA